MQRNCVWWKAVDDNSSCTKHHLVWGSACYGYLRGDQTGILSRAELRGWHPRKRFRTFAGVSIYVVSRKIPYWELLKTNISIWYLELLCTLLVLITCQTRWYFYIVKSISEQSQGRLNRKISLHWISSFTIIY